MYDREYRMNVIQTIIVGSVATAIFESSKFILIRFFDYLANARLPFSLTGYWISFHQSAHSDTQEVFSAYEIVRIRIKTGKVVASIYQYTNDNRTHIYKGCGFVRGSKLSVSYEDAYNSNSELIGNYLLRVKKESEHNVYLNGTYSEHQGKRDIIVSNSYSLFSYCPSLLIRLGFVFGGKKYIFNHMKKDRFINCVKHKMQ